MPETNPISYVIQIPEVESSALSPTVIKACIFWKFQIHQTPLVHFRLFLISNSNFQRPHSQKEAYSGNLGSQVGRHVSPFTRNRLKHCQDRLHPEIRGSEHARPVSFSTAWKHKVLLIQDVLYLLSDYLIHTEAY